MIKTPQNIILLIIGLAFFCAGYIVTTTSSLHEPFVVDLRRVLSASIKTFLLISISLTIINYFFFKDKKDFTSFFFGLGALIIILTLFLILLGFSPCLVQENINRTTLTKTLYKSLLCPNYSIKSYIGLLINLVAGGIIILTTYFAFKKHKNDKLI
jgi:hypothetical protein